MEIEAENMSGALKCGIYHVQRQQSSGESPCQEGLSSYQEI